MIRLFGRDIQFVLYQEPTFAVWHYPPESPGGTLFDAVRAGWVEVRVWTRTASNLPDVADGSPVIACRHYTGGVDPENFDAVALSDPGGADRLPVDVVRVTVDKIGRIDVIVGDVTFANVPESALLSFAAGVLDLLADRRQESERARRVTERTANVRSMG